ncbi:hypothetical protein P885DRAFT_68073 [Corynascus similis CBS 632.67]
MAASNARNAICQYSTPWSPTARSPSDRTASAGPASTPTPASASFSELQSPPRVENPHSRVDMVHMQLLHHYITDTSMYPMMESRMKDIILNVALREPYVMYSVLALSAHHLSVFRPEQQQFYHNLAIQLQTQGLSIFNSLDISFFGDSVEKRIPAFIFSSVIGIHALCDMLSSRKIHPDSGIARFLEYMSLHRGILTIMHGYWDQLKKSELKVLFEELVPQWFQLTSEGRECDDIRDRLTAAHLEPDELKEALRAVDLLQCVLDARPNAEPRAYILCSWVAMLGPAFVRMLETRRPEALATLAYYFLAMHYCRGVWMMGDAGQYFLTLLAEHFRGGDCRPQDADAPRIAEIHLAAMDANPLLHAQFPAPESLKSLQRFLEVNTVEQLRDPSTGVLVARDPETGIIAGFVKWSSPSHPEKTKLESGDLRDLKGCRPEFLECYVSLAEEAKKRCFGNQPCYYINFICTDPAYQGQGAGTLLTREVLGMAEADGLRAYLESTEVAIPMYQKLGFRVIEGFQMEIPRPDEYSVSYREACMVWYPPSMAQDDRSN